MGFADIHGYARVDTRHPQGFGICDYCGFTWNLRDLVYQFEWYGPVLTNTGYKACVRCLSKPQEQLRPIILPPDPVPLVQPRIEFFSTANGLQGFTQYTLTPTDLPALPTKSSVLSAVAAASGIATPAGIVDRSGAIMSAFSGQQAMAANAARTYLLLYGPTSAALGYDITGTATFGALSTFNPNGTPMPTTITIGENMALLWATAQAAGVSILGAVSVVGTQTGQPFWAWEA